jgi:putative RecB family exonuclease
LTLTELRRKPHLSASAIGDYVECGLLYKLGRVDKIPMEFKSDALEFGSVIHLVLGEFYEERMTGNNLSIKEVHETFENEWRRVAEDRDDIKYAKGKDFETLLREGKELLTAWHNRLRDDGFMVLSVEKAFEFYLPGVPIPIIGATDLIEEDEAGTLIITDWKTSSRAYSASEVDQNMQLTMYQSAMKANGFHDREILLKFDCLIKTKTPKFEAYWTTRTDLDERRLARKVTQVWEGIRKNVFVPNDTSWKCKGCAYKSACEAWFDEEEVISA